MSRWVLVAVLALCGPGVTHAQTAERWGLPATPRGERVAALLEAIDSGDEAVIGGALTEHLSDAFLAGFPLEAHVNVFRQLHEDLPGLKLESAEFIGDHARVTLASDASGRRVVLELDFEPGADGRVAGAMVRPAGPPAGDLELPASLDAELDRLEAAGLFSGVVLVEDAGEPVRVSAHGFADKGSDVRNTPETAFNVGSIGKNFRKPWTVRPIGPGASAYPFWRLYWEWVTPV